LRCAHSPALAGCSSMQGLHPRTSRMAVLRLKGRRLLKKIGRIAFHPKLGSRPKRAAGDSATLFSNLFMAQTEVFPDFQAERDRMTYGLPGIPDVNSPSSSISGIGTFETCRGGRMMSVVRGRPEVAFRG
jgi:hypothetical protein